MAAKGDRALLTYLSPLHLPFPKLGLLVLSSLQVKEEASIEVTSAAQETSAAVGLTSSLCGKQFSH